MKKNYLIFNMNGYPKKCCNRVPLLGGVPYGRRTVLTQIMLGGYLVVVDDRAKNVDAVTEVEFKHNYEEFNTKTQLY